MRTNTLYYGDNLDILREYVPDQSVDLTYLDPPFNSRPPTNITLPQAQRVKQEGNQGKLL
ncbi:unnamed protein product [marine sediment metagenome]|uniref:DNA methylase N-4/N-6 domain-containing protein n=1 Tax=marine sediment metagenome TaxID=412755 RepID=X0VWT3_9ZZZZ